VDEESIKEAISREAKSQGRALTPADLSAEWKRVHAARVVSETIDELRALGSPVRYAATDTRDAQAVAAVIQDARAEWGPVTGLIHGAGVVSDKLIADKMLEQFDRVFETKVKGLESLLAASSSDPLRLICLFSSVIARVGNAGQCDYAMANEILNKIAVAEARRRPGCLVQSLNWGPWEGGMVTADLRERFVKRGVPLISVATGSKLFLSALRSEPNGPVEVILGPSPQCLAPTKQVEMDVCVSHQSHPYLSGHRIKGVAVIPAVLVLDWFCRAACAARPGYSVKACQDVKVLHSVTLPRFDIEGHRLRVLCIAGLREFNHLETELRDQDGTLYYSAHVEMSESPFVPPEFVPPSEPSVPWGLSAGEAYGGLLFHGPEFQVLLHLDSSDQNGASATLAGTQEMGWKSENWCTDVAMLDGGLQLARLWGMNQLGSPLLPTKLGRYAGYGADASRSGPYRCYLRARTVGGMRTISNLVFADPGGRVLATLNDVEMHTLPQDAKGSEPRPGLPVLSERRKA
jgi:NAD(P)-dependent dehydrogenase (short-subunit alcohol dehydrogenase family)